MHHLDLMTQWCSASFAVLIVVLLTIQAYVFSDIMLLFYHSIWTIMKLKRGKKNKRTSCVKMTSLFSVVYQCWKSSTSWEPLLHSHRIRQPRQKFGNGGEKLDSGNTGICCHSIAIKATDRPAISVSHPLNLLWSVSRVEKFPTRALTLTLPSGLFPLSPARGAVITGEVIPPAGR